MSTSWTSTAIASSSAEAVSAAAAHRAGGRRAALRLGALAAWSFGWLTAWGLGTACLLPFTGTRRGFRRFVFRRWARGTAALLRIRIRTRGQVPNAPFFLVSNHLSYLDIVIYAAVAPARFIAKREVRSWPGVGFLAWTMGTIFIDRGRKRDAVRVIADLENAAAGGDGIVVFAEATSTDGRTVLPFRPALLEWAARTGRPVHYASIGYRTPEAAPPAQLAVCWWGDMTFGRHLVDLCRLPWVEASLTFGGDPLEDGDRKRLAERLHRAVSAQFTPLATES